MNTSSDAILMTSPMLMSNNSPFTTPPTRAFHQHRTSQTPKASPKDLAAKLRETPRGRLKYDRGVENSAEKASRETAFQSAMEEVANELKDMKMENLREVTRKLGDKSEGRSPKTPAKKTIGLGGMSSPAYANRVEIVEEPFVQKKSYLLGEKVEVKSPKTPLKKTIGLGGTSSPVYGDRIEVVEEPFVQKKAYMLGEKVEATSPKTPSRKTVSLGGTSSPVYGDRIEVVEEPCVQKKAYMLGHENESPLGRSDAFEEQRSPATGNKIEVIEDLCVQKKAYTLGSPKTPVKKSTGASSPAVSNRIEVIEEPCIQKTAYMLGGEKEASAPGSRKEVTEEPCVQEHSYLLGGISESPFKTPNKTPMNTPVFTSPVSPVDIELQRREFKRVADVHEAKLKKRQSVQAHLDNLRHRAEEDMKLRLTQLREETERQEEEAEAHMEADRKRYAQEQLEAKRQRELQRSESIAAARELEEINCAVAARIDELTAAAEKLSALLGTGLTEAHRERQTVAVKDAAATMMEAVMMNAEEAGMPEVERVLAKVLAATGNVQEEATTVAGLEEEKQRKRKAAEVAKVAAAAQAAEAAQAAAAAQAAQVQQAAQATQAAEASAVAAAAAAAAKVEVAAQQQQQQQQQQQPIESSPSNLHLFSEASTYKDQFLAAIQPLSETKTEKAFKFACQKAVNVPVNGINATSSAHLKEKLEKLQKLLRGEKVEYSEDKFLEAGSNQLGIPLCKSVLAIKFIQQGEEVISAKPEYAFPMAQCVVALWAEFPDFGQLFIAYLYEACPYLIPHHFCQRSDTKNTLGYHVDEDGTLEDDDTFIKRMTGLTRLYAAICVTALPKADAGKEHPHGLGNLWRWLASVMNMAPLNDVTATLIYDVLETSGSELFSAYGAPFSRLLRALCDLFYPLIKAVTRPGRDSPVARLEEFLTKCLTTGTIKKPAAAIKPGFI